MVLDEPLLISDLDQLQNTIKDQCIDCSDLKNYVDKNKKILNVLHLNIRSITKNFNEFLSFLEAYDSFCDIIVLTETWQIHSDNFNINGYTVFYNNAKHNQNDGIVIYVNSSLNPKIKNVKLELSGVTLTCIDVTINNIAFCISCIYRPPSTDTQFFISDVESYLSTNNLKKQVDILIGDININLGNENNLEVNTYLSMLNRYGFLSAINSPTRVTIETTSIIDHIFIRKNNLSHLKFSPFVLLSSITDHYPVMLDISHESLPQMSVDNSIIKTASKINFNRFHDLVSEQDWTSVLMLEDAELAMHEFNLIMSNIKQNSTTIVTYKSKHRKIKPWITEGIIQSIKKKDKMKHKLLLNPNIRDKQKFTEYRNNLCKIINKRKYDYYKSKIDNANNDMKKIYKIISEATNEKNNANESNYRICNKDKVPFSNGKDMANFCNDFFINIGAEMSNNIKLPQNIPIIENQAQSSMFLRPTDNNEVIKLINSLKSNCSAGTDGIDSKILKEFHKFLATPIVHIINLIFSTGQVPSSFKFAVVTPVYKTGDKSIINNFRPISVINSTAKIFEKCLKDRLLHFFNQNNILSKTQFGFTNGLSTTDAVVELTRQIYNSLDSGNKCIAVFLDLAKAFDTVPHKSLLDVLQAYGVRGTVLDVFASYLADRTQVVKLGNIFSDPQKINIGIPQGTVLGPILFITYINSLTSMNIHNGSIISYADDTVVVFSGKTWDLAKNACISGIDRIKNWLDSFKLTLNLSKTNYIAFSLTSINRPDFDQIYIESLNNNINSVDFTTYLGVVIDKNLKWDQHILKLTKNLRKLIYKFYILRVILNKKLLLGIYKSLIESLLRYGIVVWGGLYHNSLSQLCVVQNYVLKVIHNKKKLYPTDLLYSEDILNVRSLYFLSTCTFMHKSKNKKFVNHSHNTRATTGRQLEVPLLNTTKNQRSYDFLAPKMYNILPQEIRLITNLKFFNKICRAYIYNNLVKFMSLI